MEFVGLSPNGFCGNEMNTIFIDGDFDSGKADCQHHCSPTCHPGQVGPDWEYGCRHIAWPQNKARDFVPFVNCEGNKDKCDLKKTKFLGYYKRGLRTRIRNCEYKLEELNEKLKEI